LRLLQQGKDAMTWWLEKQANMFNKEPFLTTLAAMCTENAIF